MGFIWPCQVVLSKCTTSLVIFGSDLFGEIHAEYMVGLLVAVTGLLGATTIRKEVDMVLVCTVLDAALL